MNKRGSYARKTEVTRDEKRNNEREQRWVDRTDRPVPEEYKNKTTTVLRVSLKKHLAMECVRYYEKQGRVPAVVNGLMNGKIDAPLDLIKRHAKMIMAEAASRGLVAHGKL